MNQFNIIGYLFKFDLNIFYFMNLFKYYLKYCIMKWM